METQACIFANSLGTVPGFVSITIVNESCSAMSVLIGEYLDMEETMDWKTLAFLIPRIGEHGIRRMHTACFLDCPPFPY